MAFTNKPTYIPEWASTDVYNAETETYNVVAPDDAKKELGWDAYEKPPRNYMNWLQRGNYLWINYFEQFFGDSHELLVDVIEPNGASGVTIDGVTIKSDLVSAVNLQLYENYSMCLSTNNTERLRLAASTPQITVANNARDLVDSSGCVVADKMRGTFGIKPAGYYYNNAGTENDVFDALSSYIPNTDDEIIVSGALYATSNALVGCSRAKRISSTIIHIYGAFLNTSGPSTGATTIQVDDGTSGALSGSLAW